MKPGDYAADDHSVGGAAMRRLIDEALQAGRNVEAESLAHHAHLSAPKEWGWLQRHAQALAQLGRDEEAEAALIDLVNQGGDRTVAAQMLLAQLRHARNDVDGVIALFERMAETPALTLWALQSLLRFSFGRDLGAQPQAWFKQMIALEPGYDDTPDSGPVVEADVIGTTDDPAALAAILRRHGCAILRGVFDPAALAPAAARLSHLTVTDPGPGYRDFLTVVGGPEAAQSLIPSAVIDGLSAFFGRPAALAPEQCWARQVRPDPGEYLHWHQDAARIYINGVVCWTPMDPCGVDAPGLELAARRLRRQLDRNAVTSAASREVIDPAELAHWAPPDTWIAPRFAPGDCALFLTSQAHRTHVTPAMTQIRRSLEFRFI